MECKKCEDTYWVCETHGTGDWSNCPDCEVKSGIPCPECNPSDYDNPPKMEPGFKIIYDKDGYRH